MDYLEFLSGIFYSPRNMYKYPIGLVFSVDETDALHQYINVFQGEICVTLTTTWLHHPTP